MDGGEQKSGLPRPEDDVKLKWPVIPNFYRRNIRDGVLSRMYERVTVIFDSCPRKFRSPHPVRTNQPLSCGIDQWCFSIASIESTRFSRVLYFHFSKYEKYFSIDLAFCQSFFGLLTSQRGYRLLHSLVCFKYRNWFSVVVLFIELSFRRCVMHFLQSKMVWCIVRGILHNSQIRGSFLRGADDALLVEKYLFLEI